MKMGRYIAANAGDARQQTLEELFQSASRDYLGGSNLLELGYDSYAIGSPNCHVDIGRQAEQGWGVHVWQGLNHRHIVKRIGRTRQGQVCAREWSGP